MLEKIALKHVGPAPEMSVDLAPRLNLLTGDTATGKTFLLDIAWWALTRTWAGYPALPLRGVRGEPTIERSGRATPVTHASAGETRLLSLAYLLVWAWSEHKVASQIVGCEREDRIVLLLDEVEAHLPATQQRTLLPALVEAVRRLDRRLKLQIIATTQAVAVTEFARQLFNTADQLFDLGDGRDHENERGGAHA